MTLQFKSTSADTRKLKTASDFSNIGNAVGATATENCSVLNPVWLLEYDSDYKDATHVSCSEFGRTYYIKDLVMGTGNKCYVYGSVDVLATYSDAIMSCPVCVTRSENAGVNWVVDSAYPINPNKKRIIKDKFLSTPFEGTPSYFVEFSEFSPYTFDLPVHPVPVPD